MTVGVYSKHTLSRLFEDAEWPVMVIEYHTGDWRTRGLENCSALACGRMTGLGDKFVTGKWRR